MKAIATSCIRAANFGDAHGGIYLVDLEKEKIEKHIPWSMDIMSRDGYNERGGDRGLRGILVREHDVVMADAYGLMVFDKDLNLKQRVENKKYFRHIHEICEYNGSIWVASTDCDCVVRVNSNTFEIEDAWFVHTTDGDNRSKLARTKTDNPSGHKHKLHINSISSFAGRVVISGTGMAGLFDFETMEPVLGWPVSAKHNFYEYEDCYMLNNTKTDELTRVWKSDTDWPETRHITPRKDVKSPNDAIAKNNFVRGLARLSGKIIAGSSPARIAVVDDKSFDVDKIVELSDDVKCAVHGLEFFW